ncbi:DUF4328 domain-containing protein [Streptomyces sp. NBC_00161]|uniref:DUF4328 domain-containing protein n=1 Tax=Streptomyces sp. NBC_00161 TaxID=2975671 RepID=UPI00324D7F71
MSFNEPPGEPTPPPSKPPAAAEAPPASPAPAPTPTEAPAPALTAAPSLSPSPSPSPEQQPPAAQPYPQHAPPQPYPAQAYPAQPYPGPQPYPGLPYAGQSPPGHPAGPYPGLPYPGPHPATDVLRSPRGLAVALTALLSVAAVVNLFAAGISGYVFSLMQSLIADPAKVGDSTLERGDLLTGVAGVLQSLMLLATAVVFVIWFHRVRVNGEIFDPSAFSQTRGWAIGSWFIPFGNLFMPFRIAKQIWAASTQRGPDGSYREVSAAALNAWWALWVGSLLLDRVFGRLYDRAETPQALRTASAMGIVTGLFTVGAAVLAAVFVRRLTALQTTKAEQGPYAAV